MPKNQIIRLLRVVIGLNDEKACLADEASKLLHEKMETNRKAVEQLAGRETTIVEESTITDWITALRERSNG